MKLAIPESFLSAMKPRPRQGLVIRAKEVVLAALSGRKLSTCVRKPLEGTGTEVLGRALQAALTEVEIKQKDLAVAIPTQDVLFRFFSMPSMPKNEWEAAVQFEARKYIPFKIESLVWDYQVSPSATPDKLDVVFAAIPREAFVQMQDVLNSVGVQAILIEPRTLSLSRLITAVAGEAANAFHCIVEIEQDQAHIVIVRNQIPYLARDIGLHSRAVSPEPESTVGQPIPAPVSADPGDQRVQRLLSELSVSIDFFQREYGTATISRVVLFGEEERTASWVGRLSAHFQCPVELGTELIHRVVGGSVPLSLASTAGLLQVSGDPRRAPINFLKRGVAKAAPAQSLKTGLADAEQLLEAVRSPQIMVVAALACAFLGALQITTGQWVPSSQRELERLTQSRPELGWGLNTLTKDQLEPIREQVQGHLDRLKVLVDESYSFAEKMDALARSLPDGVWLRSLDYENRMDLSTKVPMVLNVDGSCRIRSSGSELHGIQMELQAIQKFEAELRKQEGFLRGMSTARIEQINAEVDADFSYRSFQLRCAAERRL